MRNLLFIHLEKREMVSLVYIAKAGDFTIFLIQHLQCLTGGWTIDANVGVSRCGLGCIIMANQL
jgi:hypothetical protein